jgi:hypothetical protein
MIKIFEDEDLPDSTDELNRIEVRALNVEEAEVQQGTKQKNKIKSHLSLVGEKSKFFSA